MTRSTRLLTGLVLAGAVALAGCTAPNEVDDVPTTSPAQASPEDQVAALLTALGTSSDPAQCDTAYTDRALEQALGSTDPEACREAVRRVDAADEVTVDRIRVDGDRASARTVSVGGENDGIGQVLDLVRVDGAWRVDRYTGIEIVDRAAVDERTTAVIRTEGPGLMPPEKVTCVDTSMRASTDEELERLILTGSTNTALIDAIRDCVGGGIDLTAILFLSSYQLEQAGLTRDQADCVAGLAIVDYGDLSLEQIVTDPASRDRWQQGLVTAAAYGADDVGADGSLCSNI